MSASTTPPDPSSHEPPAVVPKGWTPLPAEHLPLPTFWPAALALSITFIFWGLIASWVILIVGIGVFAGSLGGWIRDLRYERK